MTGSKSRKPTLFDIADHAHYRAYHFRREGNTEAFADGFSPGQNRFAIAWLMTATAAGRKYRRAGSRDPANRNAHGMEVVRSSCRTETLRCSAKTSTGRPSTAKAARSHLASVGYRWRPQIHAAQRCHLREKVIVEAAASHCFGRFGNGYRHGQNVARLEARVSPMQGPETANHKTGADQQHQRERYFGDNKCAARAAAARIAIGFAGALFRESFRSPRRSRIPARRPATVR